MEEVIDSSFFSEEMEEKTSVDVKKTGFETVLMKDRLVPLQWQLNL